MITDNESRFKKNKLLQELSNLGYHSNGRKQRADKGQNRGAITKPTERNNNDKMGIYQRVKSRMFNKDIKLKETQGYGTFLEVDENSFYCLIPARYKTEGHSYDQNYQGRNIQHTVRKICIQKEVDLEEYRFNAYKEKAVLTPNEKVPEKYWPEIRQMLNVRFEMTGDEATMAIHKREITWLELFCEFYFLEEQTCWLWDYTQWKIHYSFIPTQKLSEDFKFNINNLPGSNYFHPEWAYKAKERKEQVKEEIESERQRKANQFVYNMKRRTK